MMNPHIRPATAADVPARFPQMPARPADSRPDSFRAGARKYTDAKSPLSAPTRRKAFGSGRTKAAWYAATTSAGDATRAAPAARSAPGGCSISMTSASRPAPGAGAWVKRSMRR